MVLGTRLVPDGSTVKEKRFRYSCHYIMYGIPGQCDGRSGCGVTKLDAIVNYRMHQVFGDFRVFQKTKLLQDMLHKDMESSAERSITCKEDELGLKDDERDACTFMLASSYRLTRVRIHDKLLYSIVWIKKETQP